MTALAIGLLHLLMPPWEARAYAWVGIGPETSLLARINPWLPTNQR